MKRISTLWGIVIIVVAALVLFGGVFAYQYFATKTDNTKTAGLSVQSQQATEGWKTYTNTQYGFSIQYPGDTQITNISDNDPLSNEPILINVLLKPAGAKGSFMINVRNKNDGCYDTALGSNPEFPSINSTKFVEWDISKYLSTGTGLFGIGREYCAARDGLTYGLVAKTEYSANDKIPSIEPIFNQILSTFKFTTPTNQTTLPVITSLSANSGKQGDIITIFGSNLIENGKDLPIIWIGSTKVTDVSGLISATYNKIIFTVPQLIPGAYNLYFTELVGRQVSPPENSGHEVQSNTLPFTITK